MCSSSLTILHSGCYVLMVLFITSACAYVIDSDELRNSLNDQEIGMDIPSYHERLIRTTKFPRIGRSSGDLEETSSILDENDENNNENESRWFEQRSVLFPRIGKRAFHNILWANSYSNPHRMLDAQGRYHFNGYDYHIHPNQPHLITPNRGKRSAPM